MNKSTFVIALTIGGSLFLAAKSAYGQAPGRTAPCPNSAVAPAVQFYECHWNRFPGKPGVWYRMYFKMSATKRLLEHHYVVWYQDDPQHCYCYNPRAKKYWGRWHYQKPGNPTSWRFSVVIRAEVGDRPRNLQYRPPQAPPFVPGTDLQMQPPSNLPPSDLPPV